MNLCKLSDDNDDIFIINMDDIHNIRIGKWNRIYEYQSKKSKLKSKAKVIYKLIVEIYMKKRSSDIVVNTLNSYSNVVVTDTIITMKYYYSQKSYITKIQKPEYINRNTVSWHKRKKIDSINERMKQKWYQDIIKEKKDAKYCINLKKALDLRKKEISESLSNSLKIDI
jgi:hypothetical protein